MIKVAQIGTSANSHGNGIWGTMQKYPDLFELVGYAFPENEREKFPKQAEAFKGYREMTVEEILSDPEIQAVTVETEEIYLTKYALMVAKAGKHLHMEKPGGREPEEFDELIDTLKEKNLVFSLGYMYRFNPKYLEVLDKIKNGDLGEIYAVEAHMDCKHNPETRQWLENFPGGMMFFLGCHLVDLIYRIQGEPLEVIPMNCSTGFDGVTTDDYGMVCFRYPRGISFAKTCAYENGGYQRRQLVVCGSKGTVILQPFERSCPGGMYTGMRESYEVSWHGPEIFTQSEPFGRYDAMMVNFHDLVVGKKENPYTYEYERGLYKLVLRACGKELAK